MTEIFKELYNNTFSIFSNGLPKFIPVCDAVTMRGGLSGGYHLKTIKKQDQVNNANSAIIWINP